MSTNLSDAFIAEIRQEAKATRSMLDSVPEADLAWTPHSKSMSMGRLADHIAEMYSWVAPTFSQTEMDLANHPAPSDPESKAAILERFDKNVDDALSSLQGVADTAMGEVWTLRSGEQVFFAMPRVAVLRSMVLNHIVHHRGQLGVYLRLRDVPLPAVYGPSADSPA